MIKTLTLAAALVILTPAALPAAAQSQPAHSPARAFEAFMPLIGKTWRGSGTGPDGRPVEDVARWEWAVGGHAVRVVHVAGGNYGGETLIGRDRQPGNYFFHYFTNGGFHTTGTMTSTRAGVFTIEQTVHGAGPEMQLRSECEMGADGVYRVRTSRLVDGEWKVVGGFDYREDPGANADLPMPG